MMEVSDKGCCWGELKGEVSFLERVAEDEPL